MSNQRRIRRRLTTRDDELMPLVPGVIPNDSDEWKRRAMDEAHEVLPYIPDTRVAVGLIRPDAAGLALVEKVFGAEGLELVTGKLADYDEHAWITLATRERIP